jgi:hypothetical protein
MVAFSIFGVIAFPPKIGLHQSVKQIGFRTLHIATCSFAIRACRHKVYTFLKAGPHDGSPEELASSLIPSNVILQTIQLTYSGVLRVFCKKE